MSTTNTRYVRENGVLYKECNGRYESYDAEHPLLTQWVVDMIPVEGAGIERTRCEHKGSLPHPATRIVVWELASGRQTKFMCEEHYQNIGSQPYWFGTLDGVNY
jgi:hypothetical protein